MIRRIAKIENVGQYENFTSNVVFTKNVAVFGFNGAGKSTLSDVLYSLANEGRENSIIRRRTLKKDGETADKNITVHIEDDNGSVFSFAESEWDNRPNNMHVFNNQYIDEHVFVSKQLEGNVATVGMGREGAKYLKERDLLLAENETHLKTVNEKISFLSKADIKIKDFSSSKITEKNANKRMEKLVGFKMYPVGEEAQIYARIKANQKYTGEINLLNQCKDNYDLIKAVEPLNTSVVLKKINRVPRVSSKEIASFLAETLTNADIQWAVRGYRNQKDKKFCPMCGQSIREKRAVDLFNKLGKYISQDKGEYVAAFSRELYDLASQLQNIRTVERIEVFNQIIADLDSAKLLLKKDSNRLAKGLSWTTGHTEKLNEIIEKIRIKAENPYIDITLSNDEKETLTLLNGVIKNIKVLEEILQDAKDRLDRKVDRSISIDEMGKLYELSYGASGSYRNEANIMKNVASRYLKNLDRIAELAVLIDDCYNQSRLNEVNDFLKRLNTHLRIEVKDKKYYIRLKNFQPKESAGLKDTIFSEGESKAIAFAYFLAEVNDKEDLSNGKIIVIDDPISSMDHSRKSIISHQVSDMMNNQDWQVILLTHDISFLERVQSYVKCNNPMLNLELRSNREEFLMLNIDDYLTDDEKVYEGFIKAAETSQDEIDKIIALMSMRPYAYVKKVPDAAFEKIMEASTFYSHTLYSKNKRLSFKASNYNNRKIRAYIRKINSATRKSNDKFDIEAIAGDYAFTGFDFEKLANLYKSLPLDSIDNMRKKMLLMRPLIEASLFQFSAKSKFDPENMGVMFNSAIRSNSSNNERKAICIQLKELYDSTKKYHHGAYGGSLLGISWINPSEVEYYDEVLLSIVNKIENESLVRAIVA
ncbi:AAA family ATPase [Butyrivibrio sp. WCE2006]|uniref:AAA family ATPase n=1 Tax=Butyrivibrio sp. WCE2006 TaxID=1410611 RepID=UPI0005D2547C|nr:AAA family ATPase [Butyrivibrio sp. WCE2006]